MRQTSGIAAGALVAGTRPLDAQRGGDEDILTTNTVTGATKRRYGAGSPGPNDRGATQELVLYAGEGVDAIGDVPPAGDLVARLWKECLAARP